MEENNFAKEMKAVINTLAEIVKKEENDDGRDYLVSCFENDRNLFCQFVGFAYMEMRRTEYDNIDIVTGMWSQIAMAGFALGRREGYDDHNRIHEICSSLYGEQTA